MSLLSKRVIQISVDMLDNERAEIIITDNTTAHPVQHLVTYNKTDVFKIVHEHDLGQPEITWIEGICSTIFPDWEIAYDQKPLSELNETRGIGAKGAREQCGK